MKTTIKKICLTAFMLIGLTAACLSAEIDNALQDAKKIFALIDANNAYIEKLENLLNGIEFPVGLQKSINNTRITIAASSGRINPQTDLTELDFFARIEIGTKDTIFFGAKGIKLSYSGDIIGATRLVLLKNQEIPIGGSYVILRLLGSFDMSTGNMNDLTYVEIDCNGFKSLGLSAEVELSPALCHPVIDSTGKADTASRVVGKFKTQISGLDDILASVTFPSFEIKGLSGFIWNLHDAVFDFSDLRNDSAVLFPNEYRQYLIPGNEILWNGVYVRELSVTLPPQFEKAGYDTVAAYKNRTSFMAANMLIDENGVTGLFSGENILSINEGSASGWEFSLDHFHLHLLANTLEEANFRGKVGIPLSEKTRFAYNGLITADDKYILQIATLDTISFDIFMAQAEIDPNSYIEFTVDKGKFRPKALLHGRMKMDVKMNENSNSNLAEFKGIEFRSLLLQTQSPYFSVEYLGYKDEIKFQGFPVSVSNIALATTETEALLGFNMELALMDGDFGAKTRLEIVGEQPDGKIHKWKFKKLNINDIEVNATIANLMKITGSLTIKNDDPVYGDGFGGSLALDFTGGPVSGLKAEMRGMFGKKDFRYWFIDGKATIPGQGIPVLGILNLKGFGGGLTYRMKGTGKTKTSGSVSSVTEMEYVPDKNYSLGIKASAAFTIISDATANGEACFELAFNNHGGLNYAGFYGFAKFVGKLPGMDKFQDKINESYQEIVQKEKDFLNSVGGEEGLKRLKQYDPNEAGKLYADKNRIDEFEIKASLGIQFNFAESSFHANFELYVSVFGGIIKGAGQNNKAGFAVIHIDPQDKYIYMGTPTDRIGLKFGLGGLLNVETGSYFMVGTKIPASPPPPPQVASILGMSPDDLDYMRDLNALGEGKGFAFGSHLSVNTGDITFLILYAHFEAGLGFDIMLKDYGDAECKGRSGAIGIDGWYANGQAYAYLSGELGVKVNLWFIKARIPIITADFAALLQAKLPNPSSFKAYIAVKAKVLGIVKVNCRFKLSIGEECELVIPGGSPVDMIMITDVSPTDASSDISVFTAPSATFAMEIGKPFTVQDDDGEKVYKIQLKDFILNDGSGDVIGNLKWGADKDEVSFYSHEILPEQKEITANIRVTFEQYANGRWSQVYTAGKEAMEIKTVKFTTGAAPEDIPMRNVVYSYPVVEQKYYLKDEHPSGYIQLEFGQSYLFPPELENKVCIEDESGNKQYADFAYNQEQKRIDFTMPAIQNQEQYKFNILSFNKGEAPTATGTTTSSSIMDDEEFGNIDIETKTATSEARTDVGKSLLAYEFSSSRYSTFKQKIDNIVKGKAAVIKLDSDVLMFEYETVDMEPFDLTELIGSTQSEDKPLITLEAALDESFYTAKIRPLLYEDYPVQGLIRLTNRDVNIFGVPPAKALPIMTTYLNQIENGNFNGLVTKRFPYYYNLPQIYKFDFINLQGQVINAYFGNTSNPAYQRFVSATYPFITPGNYMINLKYNLPGGISGTSSTFSYYNFIQ
ncbi:MAG: hypothetical protein LBS69_11415 [Prevotellaceae bacterium]|jgi:hypothetical protein|nr:hypothetical protein [Prevotellaceae bacterium]